MTTEMLNVREAIMSGHARTDDFEGLPLPEWMLAVTTHKDEAAMFEGLDSWDKDPRKSLHVDRVAVPEVGPNEALVAVMASSINFNTVWSSIFEPLSTFLFLERAAKKSPWDRRHDLPYHILGSDAAGVVLKVGPGVNLFRPGDEVTIHCNYVDMQAPDGHDDSMLDPDQRIWGFETNFGGLAEIALVRANQLMPKPPHLTWEEAASMPLVNSTAYRMLVSHNGTQIKQGDIVLIWGAVGGLGGFALQYVLNAGAFPICVVSVAGEGAPVRNHRRALGDRPQRRGLRVLERGRLAEPGRAAPLRQADPRDDGRRRPRHGIRSIPATKPLRPASSWRGPGVRSSPALRPAATTTNTTTAICG